MNKNTIIILFVIIAAVAVYFFLVKEDTTSPVTNKVETTKVVESLDYVGLTTTEAAVKAQAEGMMFRVVMEDGQPQPTTRDFQEGRISATVEAGVVTRYTVETLDSTPAENTDTESANHDAIIGMTIAEATAYAAANEIDFRTGTIDGESMPVTMDFRPGRITAEITNGVVVGYSVE